MSEPREARETRSASSSSPARHAGLELAGGSTGLVDELQQGISREAQPMLTFLATHFRKIILGAGVAVALVGAYGIYEYSATRSLAAARSELGNILVNTEGTARLDALSAFAVGAPEGVRANALFELVRLAQETGDFSRALTGWGALASTVKEGETGFIVSLGKAQALLRDGKASDALVAMETVAASAPEAFASITLLQLAMTAEQAGNLPRALTAYEALQDKGNAADQALFARRIASLRTRIGG